MTQELLCRSRAPRRERLAACVAAACAFGLLSISAHAAAYVSGVHPLSHVSPGMKRGGPARPAQTWPVMSCADDSMQGTLRSIISNGTAHSGDTIDLSQLPSICGRDAVIVLGNLGEITVALDDLYLKGPSDGSGTVTISGNDSSRIFNHMGSGPGVAQLTLDHLILRDGKVAPTTGPAAGGCIASNSDVWLQFTSVENCRTYSTNDVSRGGGISAAGNVMLIHSTITGNYAKVPDATQLTALGGGIDAGRGLTSKYSAFRDNQTIYGTVNRGGGAYVAGAAVVLASTFTQNVADDGGALYLIGSSYLTNSTVVSNIASTDGGGVLSTGPLVIANSTIASNTAGANGHGGGIEMAGAMATLELQSSIVALNSVMGGVNNGSDLDITQGGPLSGSDNLVMYPLGVTLPSPVITTQLDPELGHFGFNGGPVQTWALRGTSPAIGHGNNSAGMETDQRGRGYPRTTTTTAGTTTDMGAYQYDSIFASDLDP